MKSANSPRHWAIAVPPACGRPLVSDVLMHRAPGAHPVPFEGNNAASAALDRTGGAGIASSPGSASSGASVTVGDVEGVAVDGGASDGCPPQPKAMTRSERDTTVRARINMAPPDAL